MTEIKQQEYDLLNEIAQNSMVTQANLSDRLDIAVGSVNWYIKRLRPYPIWHEGFYAARHVIRPRFIKGLWGLS